MALQKGDFIILSYNARIKETNEIFDTTDEETAKKEHLQKEGEIYEPRLVVIGENWVLKSLDEDLTSMELNKPKTVEITPDKAFGPRDPEKVRRVPLKQLTSKDINPRVGMRIELNGKAATIRAVGAGRVLLDYNPALAGKTLVYEATVQKKLEMTEEKIPALVHRRIPNLEPSKIQFIVRAKTLDVEMPEEAYYLEGIQISKRGIAMDIQRFLPEITTVRFIETYKMEKKEPEEKEQISKTEQPEAESEAEAETAAK